MKENILDVLLYLFENYFYDNPDTIRGRDLLQKDSLQNDLLLDKLSEVGFSPVEVNKAFDWLDDLANRRPALAALQPNGPIRLFVGTELDRLDAECRGFLMFLEQHGIIDANQREWVLDRALALDQEDFDLDDLKWVVLMVLFNQPGAEAAFAWMETQIFDDTLESVH